VFLCVGLDEFILVLFAFVEFSFFSTKGQRSVKVKVGFLYSAAYVMTEPARFTISEVAVDWQEPMAKINK